MDELLEMASKGEVKGNIQEFFFEDLNEVLKKLRGNEIVGRAVMRLPGN